MIPDTFQIAQNEKTLEYYSYLRTAMEDKQMNYWMGNPSVQIISGIIYFKSQTNIQTNTQLDTYQTYLKQYRHALLDHIPHKPIRKTLVLVGIPNSKSPIEACQKLAPYLDWILQMKVVKANCFKYYAILMLLKDQDVADKFYREIMGDQYNGVEIQRLLLRQMVSVSYTRTQTIRAEKEQLFQHHKKSALGDDLLEKIPAEQLFLSSKNQKQTTNCTIVNSPKKKQLFLNSSNAKTNQNSVCAICLQQSSGTLISILCCHYFHLKCLSQWKQIICPLCRYHQQPPLIKFCQKCNQCQGLWICLICGVRLCCGLDHNILGKDSHIYQHSLEMQHRLSMNVQTKFIFDAMQLSFLHQMFYKQIIKNDNIEIVESEKNNIKTKKTKLNHKISEYEHNISEEMQKQRLLFQETINREVKSKKQLLKEKRKTITELESQLLDLNNQLEQTDEKNKQQEAVLSKLEKQLKLIKTIQLYWKNLSQKKQQQNQQKLQQNTMIIKKLDLTISQKKQQLKDLKKNIEISQKLKDKLGKDIIENSVILELGIKDIKKKKK